MGKEPQQPEEAEPCVQLAEDLLGLDGSLWHGRLQSRSTVAAGAYPPVRGMAESPEHSSAQEAACPGVRVRRAGALLSR